MSTEPDIDRRKLLGALGLGLLLPVIGCRRNEGGDARGAAQEEAPGERLHQCSEPPWEQGQKDPGPNPYVEPALRRARELGKPLLVIVVPVEKEAWWKRQDAFGELLTHGSEALLLDLALCEVLVASRVDLARHVPRVAGDVASGAEPLLIVLGVDGALRTVPFELPSVPEIAWREIDPAYEEAVRARIESLEQLLHEVLAPDADALARRAETAWMALATERVERIATACEGEDALEPEVADEGAAIVRARIDTSDDPELRRCLFDSLLAGTKRRLREGPPLGARWSRSEPCGSTLEAVPEGHAAQGEWPARSPGFSCGMAHVPAISRRFLSFWGQGPWG